MKIEKDYIELDGNLRSRDFIIVGGLYAYKRGPRAVGVPV